MSRNSAINSTFTLDCVIFGFDEKDLKVLLINRGEEPYNNTLAIPGDFVQFEEEMDFAARRVLNELTGLENIYMEQLAAFADKDRHPWGRILTVAFYALINIKDYKLSASSFATDVNWVPLNQIKTLAFDHKKIVEKGVDRLRRRIKNRPVGFELLPKKFTLRQLQNLYESILDEKLDKRNFRRKFLKIDLLQALEEWEENVSHKPAQYYMFNQNKYNQMVKEGYKIELF